MEAWMIEDNTDKRKKRQWTDWIARESLLLFHFNLTKTNHRKKETVICLKTMYNKLNIYFCMILALFYCYIALFQVVFDKYT